MTWNLKTKYMGTIPITHSIIYNLFKYSNSCNIPVIQTSFSDGSRQTWMVAQLQVEGALLHQYPFMMLVDYANADSDTWKVLKVMYHLSYLRSFVV